MDVRELRIGNWMNFDTDRGIVPMQIESIRKDKVSSGFEVSYYDDERCQPISLTNEIMLKAGWKELEPWAKGNLRLDGESRLIVIDNTGYGIIVARNIKYVHQLQNHYFALTGEELEFKL